MTTRTFARYCFNADAAACVYLLFFGAFIYREDNCYGAAVKLADGQIKFPPALEAHSPTVAKSCKKVGKRCSRKNARALNGMVLLQCLI